MMHQLVCPCLGPAAKLQPLSRQAAQLLEQLPAGFSLLYRTPAQEENNPCEKGLSTLTVEESQPGQQKDHGRKRHISNTKTDTSCRYAEFQDND